jgi:hypothetical protein
MFPSPVSKSKRRKKLAMGRQQAVFLLGLFFDPENGGNTPETSVSFYQTTRHYIQSALQERVI